MVTRISLEHFWTERFANLGNGCYEAVYRSYHQSAPFRENFTTSHEYVRFAKAQLAAIEVKNWQFLKFRELSANQAECLIAMQLSCDGIEQFFYELALVLRDGQQWFYHSAQKLSSDDYSGDPWQIDFSHFDQASQKFRM